MDKLNLSTLSALTLSWNEANCVEFKLKNKSIKNLFCCGIRVMGVTVVTVVPKGMRIFKSLQRSSAISRTHLSCEVVMWFIHDNFVESYSCIVQGG